MVSGSPQQPNDQRAAGGERRSFFLTRWFTSLYQRLYEICITFFAIPPRVSHNPRRLPTTFHTQLTRRLLDDPVPANLAPHPNFHSKIHHALMQAIPTRSPIMIFVAMSEVGIDQVKAIWVALHERLERDFKLVGLMPDNNVITHATMQALGIENNAARDHDLEIVTVLPYRFSTVLVGRLDSVMSMSIHGTNGFLAGVPDGNEEFSVQEELFADLQNAALTEGSALENPAIDPILRFTPGGVLRVALAKIAKGTSDQDLITLVSTLAEHTWSVSAPLRQMEFKEVDPIRSLREQQEQEFQDALRADQEKEEQRRQEAERRMQQEREEEAKVMQREKEQKLFVSERGKIGSILLNAQWNDSIPTEDFVCLMVRLGPVKSQRVLFKVWNSIPVGIFREIVGLSDVWLANGNKVVSYIHVGVNNATTGTPTSIEECAVRAVEPPGAGEYSGRSFSTDAATSQASQEMSNLARLYSEESGLKLKYELARPRIGSLVEDSTIKAAGIVSNDALLYVAKEMWTPDHFFEGADRTT